MNESMFISILVSVYDDFVCLCMLVPQYSSEEEEEHYKIVLVFDWPEEQKVMNVYN